MSKIVLEGSIISQLRKTALRGNIEKVFHSGPKFSAGRLRDEDGRSRSFAGDLFALEGQHVALAGHWEPHPDYGQQLFNCGLRNDDCGFDEDEKWIHFAI
jgi:hypothetical protein